MAEFAISGVSVAVATICTNPLDVIKTRLQLQVSTGIDIVKNEGALALWKGLPPAVVRGLTYGGLRLGLYSPIKSMLVGEECKQHGGGGGAILTKILAGSMSGGIAAVATSPTELVKGWTANYARLGPQTVVTFIVNEKVRFWLGVDSL
eukprot:gene12522-15738_t